MKNIDEAVEYLELVLPLREEDEWHTIKQGIIDLQWANNLQKEVITKKDNRIKELEEADVYVHLDVYKKLESKLNAIEEVINNMDDIYIQKDKIINILRGD